MQVRLPDIICDTGFLIHMASGRIQDSGYVIGSVTYLVPDVVISELNGLMNNPGKYHDAVGALRLADSMQHIQLGKKYADQALLDYVKVHGGIVATTDRQLKRAIKAAGRSVISLHNNNIILE
ncbi:MAG: twitching motility protein PilT [Cenarchaeum sp. SB0667_bin_13]|nr:twitching motility protein PilT [Cenarchaeum sp. SB0667_bin_13]MYB47267.1 twitching motility protein PilT [Cenarchaeum sp. SB0662_bin_33]